MKQWNDLYESYLHKRDKNKSILLKNKDLQP